MSVDTTYDEMREELRNNLTDCLRQAKDMLDENIWGYEDMRKDYITDIYVAIKKARDMV